MKDQLDVQFHTYMPPESVDAVNVQSLQDNPETQIILDALLAKETPEKLLELIQTE